MTSLEESLPPWARALSDDGVERVGYFCEENVHRLLASARLPAPSAAVFITNERRQVAMWHQRAAAVDPIVWDYHVVAFVDVDGGYVVDVDSTAGLVSSRPRYAALSFRTVRAAFRPRFRVVPRAAFLRSFASDRRHMRDDAGAWLQPPPPWPAPVAADGASHTLPRFLDVTDDSLGVVVDLAGFLSLRLVEDEVHAERPVGST